ncbi:MAG TPA: hypothetical protein VFP10_03355 [Candidatus Eisenbacteria bacterium]|nr:hypothetical protein [Candidatus Eisenbacteria bacterium]
MEPGPAFRARIPALVVLAVAILSCGRLSPRSVLTENQPPEIALDAPNLGPGSQTFSWRAHDPDGRIDHYIYAVNPASVDRVDGSWVRTDQANAVVRFPRVASPGRLAQTGKEETAPRIFTVRAVDDRGAESVPVSLAVFDSTELAPTVTIDDPDPSSVFTPVVPPSFEIRWHGDDLDGRIKQYKFRLFGRKNPDFPLIPDFVALVTANPDTLNALYGPDFASWDAVSANATSTTYSELIPEEVMLFAITAFDDDGNYDPVFSTSKNVLRLATTYEQYANPQICVSSAVFNDCPEAEGDDDPRYQTRYQIVEGQALAVSWFASPAQGASIDGYRWALDSEPQFFPDAAPRHWTPWKITHTSATVGPFSSSTPGDLQVLWIQARDNFGRVSTAKIRFTVIQGSPTRALLVVDDTRLAPDQFNMSIGIYDPPRGTWPTAAELDTFLYARGGFPWKGYPGNPQGPPAPSPTLSTPGILNGYDFDTLGTRGILSGIVPIGLLTRYRQVIWFTDDTGATYTGSPFEQLAPITSLRLMSQPGYYNELSGYVAQGGKLWISGGGSAYATLIAWGSRLTPRNDWTNTDRELVPGRFMYDFPHWQSSVAIAPARQALINTPDWSPPEWRSTYSIGRGWSGHGVDRTLSQPNYGKLVNSGDVAMSILSPRTCASDPPPPQRFCNSFYLVAGYPAEYIGRVAGQSSPPNYIWEDFDSRPNQERLESTLDTLYSAIGGSMPAQLPVMTYYHGLESGSVVFSGFPVWYFQKAQCQKIVDFVLQDIWGLAKQPASVTTAMTTRRR